MIWHSESVENIAAELQTDVEKGLLASEAAQRLGVYGFNLTSNTQKAGFGALLAAECKKGLTIILLLCAVILELISVFSGGAGWYIPLVMVCILALHAVFNALQLYRAENAVEALKRSAAPTARVLREGKTVTISAAELVPGDILDLRPGDFIPADGRLFAADALRCDELVLTGESVPAEKMLLAEIEDITGVKERRNMVFAGCNVLSGTGRAIVTETGNETEQGRQESIARLEDTGSSPLREHLLQTARMLGLPVLVVCLAVFVAGLIAGVVAGAEFSANLFDNFVLCISLAKTVLPLELTGVMAVVVALGVNRLSRQKAIVKNLAAVETMGNTTVLCTDKTGTLTQKRMSVVRVYDGNELYDLTPGSLPGNVPTLLRLGALCCNARVDLVDGEEVRHGDDTEAAMVSAALQYLNLGSNDLANMYPRLGTLPFDADRKRMTTIHMIDGRVFAIVKGAPEAVLPLCLQNTQAAVQIAGGMAEDALRVLAVAVKPLGEVPANPTPEEMEQHLTLVGLVGLMDPPRKEAYAAVKACRQAGIQIVMLTGDHSATAAAIAKRLGILEPQGKVLTGEEIAAMTDEELADQVPGCRVFARISPEDKPRILAALQAGGQVVAATGKTVADAHALQGAHIAFALGSAANVTKNTADVLLKSDNFSTVAQTLFRSRGIYENIKKTLQFILTCNMATVLALLLGLCCFGTPVLQPVQLLFLQLVLAAAPALALGLEPVEPECAAKPPRGKKVGVFTPDFWLQTAWQAVLLTAVTLLAFALGHFAPVGTPVQGNTMAVLALALALPLLALSLRRERTVLGRQFITNPVLLYCVGGALAATLLFLLTPLRSLLGVGTALPGLYSLYALLLALAPFVVSEVYKLVRYTLLKKITS